ncbi:vanadium-dependent haloperoxidase [Pedobacter sp. JCM 36344]|uniref:vanadium-dependent haloperoxidase n=1 Tax=Pedobacter sp. JCM 36344 TaxID=3374280 RepID=UPI00397BC539
MKYFKVVVVVCLLGLSCGKRAKIQMIADAEVLHQNVDHLTQLIIYDAFTPPVASRIYGYTSLAAFEAIRFKDAKYNSIAEQIAGFKTMPKPQKGKKYDYTLAASKAFFTVAYKVTFSVDTLKKYENQVVSMYQSNLDDSTFLRSVAFGEQIGIAVLGRADNDGYAKSRGKVRYLGNNDNGKWRPTPPDYLEGVEFCWGAQQQFVLKSSKDFPIPPPPSFSKDKKSKYFKQAFAVYEQSKNLSPDQLQIATFWDDNPFVIEHNGHTMFANKKITPGGHWIGITAIACKKTKADAVKSAQAYALTSIALYDAFISCWEVKYTTAYIRPITVINEEIDPNWVSMLQTPPFPEFPSGHSAISGSAAVMLTHLFGDNFEYMDTSDLRYIGIQRHFTSFLQASDETSISRYYGGIHFRNSVDQGSVQGRQVGEYIWKTLVLRN